MTFFIYDKYFLTVTDSFYIMLLLDWLFYNSKNSKPNGLTSLFGKKIENF